MITAVLDTNVIISSVITPAGVPGRIMETCKAGAFKLYLTEPLLCEIERVLRRLVARGVLRFTEQDVQEFLNHITDLTNIFRGKLTIKRIITDDPDDDVVLATALHGRVDFIVSGDQHLQALKIYESIPIITPRQFLLVSSE